MKILFVGTSEFGVPTLEALYAQGRHALRVLTKPDARAGRGRGLSPPAVKVCARRLGLDVRQPADVNGSEGLEAARAFSPHVILVVSFAAKLSDAFLDIAPHGGINIHASLLPRYRGASPVAYAILNGDAATGVSIIRVAPRMDAGDVLGRMETAVNPRDTAGTLRARLARIAPPLLIRVLEDLEAGRLHGERQNEALVVNAPRLKKGDGAVDWSRPAVELDRFVRAMTPWPGAFTHLIGPSRPVRLVVLEAAPAGTGAARAGADARPGQVLAVDGGFCAACRDGALAIRRVQREGRKPMAGEEFLRGIQTDLSVCRLGSPEGGP